MKSIFKSEKEAKLGIIFKKLKQVNRLSEGIKTPVKNYSKSHFMRANKFNYSLCYHTILYFQDYIDVCILPCLSVLADFMAKSMWLREPFVFLTCCGFMPCID